MTAIPTWLGAILTLLSISSGGGALVAYFRASYAKSTIAMLKESNQARAEREGLLEDQVSALRSEVEHYKGQSMADRARVETLERALSGRAEFARLESLLEDHHREVMTSRADDRERYGHRFDRLDGSVADVGESVRQVKGILGARRRSEGTTQ